MWFTCGKNPSVLQAVLQVQSVRKEHVVSHAAEAQSRAAPVVEVRPPGAGPLCDMSAGGPVSLDEVMQANI